MNRIIKYFLRGLLYVVPMSLTIWILYLSIKFINDLLNPILEKINQIIDIELAWLGVVLGVIIIFILLLLIGYIGSIIISTPINSLFKKLLEI